MKQFLALSIVLLAMSACGPIIQEKAPPEVIWITPKPKQPQQPAHSCSIKPKVVAVIDTGFGMGWEGEESVKLCKFGHKNFVDDQNHEPEELDTEVPVPRDIHGHGTHIAGIIDDIAKKSNVNYCLVILKYYGGNNGKNTIEAINYARKIHADFINYSGGGIYFLPKEQEAVKAYIDAGGTFVAAAGNESSDLEKYPYYPAEDDDRVIVVGNGEDQDHKAFSSNYGKRVDQWERGEGVISLHHIMSGTSQATAIFTGKLLTETKNFCK